MSLTTFNLNDMVFIENIGYGTLMDCGALKTISIKQLPVAGQKKQSIYFDPELFSSEADSFGRKISQTPITVPLPENKLQQKKSECKIQSTLPITIQNEKSPQDLVLKQKQQEKINIVKLRLEGTQFLVYTPDKNIRKYVIVPVRPLFIPAIGTVNIRIEISKTVESFKREIFDFLGLKHAHYFNVKIFTTSPHLTELNSLGKTIWQYGIRESSTLVMTADHGFCFQNVPQHLAEYFAVVNNSLTFVSLPKKPKVAQNAVIALPLPQTKSQSNVQTPTKAPQNPQPVANNPQSPVKNQAKNEEIKEVKEDNTKKEGNLEPNKQKQAQKPQQVQNPQKTAQNSNLPENKPNEQEKTTTQPAVQQTQPIKQQKQPIIPETLEIKGDKFVRSGKHYFEVRLDKLPANTDHLKIGVITQSGDKKWFFSPLTQQKIYEQNGQIKITQSYGINFKQNDTVGVLVKINKEKVMKLSFFKNNVGLGFCFEAKIQEIGFVFVIGSEGQISLDTRIQPPIDSYRFR